MLKNNYEMAHNTRMTSAGGDWGGEGFPLLRPLFQLTLKNEKTRGGQFDTKLSWC